MAQLSDCPDELLLNIAANLGPPDLKALASTARKYRGAAQEVLHTHVELRMPYTTLPWLLRTLVERPDLAPKIETLEIAEGGYGIGTDYRKTQAWNHVIEHAREISKHWNVKTGWWIGGLENYDESAAIGLLLALASRLRHLSVNPNGPDYQWNSIVNLPAMFLKHGREPQATSIPILKELQSLSIPSTQLDRYWCSLPQLERLQARLVMATMKK
jgi:hypothetical protein